jgi:hypothetical protein
LSRNAGRIGAATIGAAALATTAITTVGLAPAAQAAGPAVSVWETTTDQSRLLAPQSGTAFARGGSSARQVITVTPTSTYQSMTGFGASFTDSSASLVNASPLRNSIMTKLFDPTQGIGLDFLRQPVDYEFAAENSGTECLDVTNLFSTAAGGGLQQWTCSSPDPAQSFRLLPTS